MYELCRSMSIRIRMLCIVDVTSSCFIHMHITMLLPCNDAYIRLLLALLLLISGDVERNPGPAQEPPQASSFIDISMCHLNIQSLKSTTEKFDHIKLQLIPEFDVITLSETWLNDNCDSNDYDINEYHPMFRRDRHTGAVGGGVAAWVSSRLVAKRRLDIEKPDIEAMWLEIRCHNNKFLLCVLYRPPSENIDFWDKIQDMYDSARCVGIENIIFMGDFNADDRTSHGSHLQFFLDANNLFSHIDQPTRCTDNCQSKLDKIVSNIPHFVKKSEVCAPLYTNDHCTICIYLLFRYSKARVYKRNMWKYDQANTDGLLQYMSEIDWNNECDNFNDINYATTKYSEILLNAAKRFIPSKVVTVRPNDKPWYRGHHRRLKRNCERSHRDAKRLNTPEKWSGFRKIRNIYIQSCRDAKQKYENDRLEEISRCSFQTKKCWNIYKSVLKTKKICSIPTLEMDGHILTNELDKANVFNEMFLSNSKLQENDNDNLPRIIVPDHSIDHIEISSEDIMFQLGNLDTTKAYGPDNIGPKLLKLIKPAVVEPLRMLFAASLRSKTFPDIWKEANVIPIFKKGDKSDPNNYRPVSLLNTSGKIFEKVVFKYLYNYFRDNFVLTVWQSGFRPGCSTVSQLLEIYHQFCSAINDDKEVRVVFLDISKAFERVWHAGLLLKLRKTGITGDLIEWLGNYLSHRKQRVTINGQSSDWGYSESGVPQGSILGPLLFLIFMNDLVEVVDYSNIRLYADDTCLYIDVDNRIAAAERLNKDLDSISLWAKTWLVNFNPKKTEAMIVSNKRDISMHPALSLDGHVISEVTSHKHLGVTLSSDLRWRVHINDIYVGAMKKLDILQFFKYKLDRKALENFYISFVRPCLEYADVLWSGAYDCDLVKLDRVQLRAMRIVTGATAKSNINNLYSETGWNSLSERREFHKMCTFYKIINDILPG